MFSKELMQYITKPTDEAEKKGSHSEKESVTKPLLYIVLKYNAAKK